MRCLGYLCIGNIYLIWFSKVFGSIVSIFHRYSLALYIVVITRYKR